MYRLPSLALRTCGAKPSKPLILWSLAVASYEVYEYQDPFHRGPGRWGKPGYSPVTIRCVWRLSPSFLLCRGENGNEHHHLLFGTWMNKAISRQQTTLALFGLFGIVCAKGSRALTLCSPPFASYCIYTQVGYVYDMWITSTVFSASHNLAFAQRGGNSAGEKTHQGVVGS
jgi:hypothetical protein